MMPELLKRVLRRVVPLRLREARAERFRRRVKDATTKLLRATGGRVQSGPFAGLQYIEASHSSELGPKVLGTYELELEQIVTDIAAGRFGRVVDVGAAEGYYACGLLFRNPELDVVAFESSADAQADLRRLATLNRIGRGLRIEGECTPGALEAVLAGSRRACLIVDIDGGETQLLDLERVPGLRAAHLLVEVHDFIVPGTSDTLMRRFLPTHTVRRIPQVGRAGPRLPRVPGMSRGEVRDAADEVRGGRQEWLWMSPRQEARPVPAARTAANAPSGS